MDPEMIALIEQLSGDVSKMDIAVGTAPQTGVLAYIIWRAFQRLGEAEAKLDATLNLCKELMTLHEDDNSKFSTVHVAEILRNMVDKDKRQHLHNTWVQDAMLKLVRRGSSNSEGDELELRQPSGGP